MAPLTANQFRQLALKLPGAIEASHMDHPDFRLGGKIFATLGYPDERHAMVKLTPTQQRRVLKMAPTMFKPCSGKWGERGATNIILGAARVGVIREALSAAGDNIGGK
ncbi:MAG TPA: MmcQ/YjbR family DNA-binding protein [Humisphaera sp.]|nr:MmcQ/YjbR family DNA-binding protein [Humisphaera sp.]